MEAQKEFVKKYFQTRAEFWNEIYHLPNLFGTIHQLRRLKVLQLVGKLHLGPGADILIAGCGAGGEAVALARSGYEVKAIDAAPAMVQMTLRQAAEAGIQNHVEATIGDIDDVAFRNNTFDLVLAVGVTPYLLSVEKAVCEIARVLKPGGHLIISAENRWSARAVLDPGRNPALAPVRNVLRHLLVKYGLRKGPLNALHALRCSIKQFDVCLKTFGLRKVEGTTLGFGPFSFLGYAMLPDPVGVAVHDRLQDFSNRGFPFLRSAGNQYLVLARKERNATP